MSIRHAMTFVGLLILAIVATTANAQNTNASTPHVVTGDDVYVRSGAGDSYYPFGRVQRGDIVRVVSEKHGWARIEISGPTFAEYFGYLRYVKANGDQFTMNRDGRTGRTLGQTEVRAPNLYTKYRPRDSWKSLTRVGANTELEVLERIETDHEIFYKVRLPQRITGFVSQSLLKPATARDIEAWEAHHRARTAANTDKPATPAVVTTPPASTPEHTGDTIAKETTGVAANDTLGATRDEATTRAPATPVITSTDEIAANTLDDMADEAIRTVENTLTSPTTTPKTITSLDPPAVVEMGDSTTRSGVRPTLDPTRSAVVDDVPTKSDVLGIEEKTLRTPHDDLADIEDAYRRLQQVDIRTAEVLPLRNLYERLADETTTSHPGVSRYAKARAQQLGIWADLQVRRRELDQLARQAKMTESEARQVRLAIETTGDYVAVGRLLVSSVYDGHGLPRLFRLQDPGTGRTIAYLRPDDGFNLTDMLDQLIGIVGRKTFDKGIRLNVITPARIDLLAPQG